MYFPKNFVRIEKDVHGNFARYMNVDVNCAVVVCRRNWRGCGTIHHKITEKKAQEGVPRGHCVYRGDRNGVVCPKVRVPHKIQRGCQYFRIEIPCKSLTFIVCTYTTITSRPNVRRLGFRHMRHRSRQVRGTVPPSPIVSTQGTVR